MDLNEIKDLIEKDGGKFIIVEGGKPTMVILSFEEYRKKVGGATAPKISQVQVPLQPSEPVERAREEGLTIDDLPL
ncbi:MAG: hypothetical protein HYW95_01280 [Candidatus Wildermuthbacteria bacterium]|nr:hypothetical protein [Candidatus Wildermuthbacteria bacterium]